MTFKKRLLIATDNFLPRWDGIARYLAEIIPSLLSEYEIRVIAPRFPRFKDVPDEQMEYRVIRIDTFGFAVGDYHPPHFAFRTIRQQVKWAHIVWIQGLAPIGVLSIHYARRYRKKVLATIHSYEYQLVAHSLSTQNMLKYPLSALAKKVSKHFYNRCSLLMVPSQETAEILSWQGISTRKAVVPLGVDVAKFKPTPKEEAKARLGYQPGNFVIGYSGRIAREKDLMTLYRAFLLVKKRDVNVKLLIVGDGLESLKKTMMSKEGIWVTGQTNAVQTYLQAMDVYVLPSLTETSSLATMEAMSCGIPVITTKVGMVKNYVEEGRNGLFFPFQDSYTLSQRILQLIENPSLREKFGEQARKTMVVSYAWQDRVKKIKEVLRQV
ncbi:glycosyltransferase family 4 protein [Candidatus Woesearchaeota archaeon]|nr:glycosyltransferase family 4 protein [Candidatus Woesearchaeota archaeon]